MQDVQIKNVMKNVTPAFFVMVVGLMGAFFVYQSYVGTDGTAAGIASIEPAAGAYNPVGELPGMDQPKTEISYDSYDPFTAPLPQPEAYQSIPTYQEFGMAE